LLKAVLFDLDDTLFDHRHSSREALSVLQRAYSRDLSNVAMDELEVVNLEILNTVHLEVLSGTLTPDEARVKRFGLLFRTFGLEPSTEELDSIAANYRSSYQLSRRATPGAIPLLHALRNRGLKTAIVTNNLVDEQMDKLRHCKLLELIDCIVISEEAGSIKPDVRIFETALTRLECDPHETIMIGDSWENDILGAQAAGISSIWYNCYSMEQPDRSVPEIRSLEDSNVIIRLLFPLQA
jgi:HAD superfamily hydrolase (TIGR01549 family)